MGVRVSQSVELMNDICFDMQPVNQGKQRTNERNGLEGTLLPNEACLRFYYLLAKERDESSLCLAMAGLGSYIRT